MTAFGAALVYFLCLIASVLCAGLLFRAWRTERSPLLLWTALAFGFFALNNLSLVADMVLFPITPLWPLRLATHFLAFAVLVYGFVWETGR
ncbi:MAG: DUF5985 family protein [Rhizomicrobium sp.]